MSARQLLAAIVAAVPLLFSGLAAGHGGGVPYHKSGGAYCYVEGSRGAIRAYPPVQMHAVTGTYDTVYWRAEVYRKLGGSWRRWETMPQLSRTTDRSGRLNASLGPWMHWSRGTGHKFWRFTGLERGIIYRVGETYRWSNGAVHTQWSLFSWNRNASYQCRL